jgi:transcriptional regulator with XRE-family HTH domain
VTDEAAVPETDKPDAEYERLLAEEALILDATELISELMQAKGITRAELAKQIGKTRGFVTQVLSGNRNMTLRTLADLAHALDARAKVVARPLESFYGQSIATQFSPGVGLLKPFGTFVGADVTVAGLGAIGAASASWLMADIYSKFETAPTIQQLNVFGSKAWRSTRSDLPRHPRHQQTRAVRRPQLRVIQGSAA